MPMLRIHHNAKEYLFRYQMFLVLISGYSRTCYQLTDVQNPREPDELRLHIDKGDLGITCNFGIEKEDATSVSTEFMEVSGHVGYDSQNYDKKSGITTYEPDWHGLK